VTNLIITTYLLFISSISKSEIELTPYPSIDSRIEKALSENTYSKFTQDSLEELTLINIIKFCKESKYSEDFFITNFHCNSLYTLRRHILKDILSINNLQNLITLSELLLKYSKEFKKVFPNSNTKSPQMLLTILFPQQKNTVFKGFLIHKLLKKETDLEYHLSCEQLNSLKEIGEMCLYINKELNLF
jgi:hypothetical protein